MKTHLPLFDSNFWHFLSTFQAHDITIDSDSDDNDDEECDDMADSRGTASPVHKRRCVVSVHARILLPAALFTLFCYLHHSRPADAPKASLPSITPHREVVVLHSDDEGEDSTRSEDDEDDVQVLSQPRPAAPAPRLNSASDRVQAMLSAREQRKQVLPSVALDMDAQLARTLQEEELAAQQAAAQAHAPMQPHHTFVPPRQVFDVQQLGRNARPGGGWRGGGGGGWRGGRRNRGWRRHRHDDGYHDEDDAYGMGGGGGDGTGGAPTIADVLMGHVPHPHTGMPYQYNPRGRGGYHFPPPRMYPHLGPHSDLLTREFTPDDYERLLALDESVAKKQTPTASVADLSMLPSYTAPTTPAPSSSSTAAAADNTCCICMSEVNGGEVMKRLPCLHAFHAGEWPLSLVCSVASCHCDVLHADCIDSWLQINATCPIDKLPVFEPPK